MLSLFLANTTFAELEWQSTSQNIKVHPLQASATVSFEFINTGEKSVAIIDLKPSCGCVSGEVDKKTYAPGESGTIMVTFNLQGRAGAQLKGLTVTTDDKSTKRTSLYINTTIPKSYALSVKRMIWSKDEEHVPKTIRLTNASATPFPLENAIASREGISIELRPIREGFEYELVIIPSADLKSTLVPIIIYPEKPEELDAVRTYTVYALVK